jgi:predicted homoserine dehydrogenase-like protein
MIIVDTALKKRAAAANPVRVGLIGAGFMGRGIANHIINFVPGLKLVAISNRSPASATAAYRAAGVESVEAARTVGEVEEAVARSRPVVVEDALLLSRAAGVDILIEATGAIEFGAHVVLSAIEHGKDVVLMNAELDATVGPILKVYADRAGVIVTGCDGDQPGVQMNLYRFVKSLGLTPLVCGNIKGLQDRRRTPTTQAGFARQWGQTPHMVTSFADGTKISFEQAIVANATNMRVAQRGMLGHQHTGHVDDMTAKYDVDRLRALGGIVDYVVGAKPSPGVFVFAAHEDPKLRHYLNYGKLGEGPLYSFYVPYHLTVFEVPVSVARVALFRDTVIAPLAGPVVEVVATAKVDLEAGQTLDGLGHYMTYGQCENADVVREQCLLPMGVAEGCRLKRDIAQDEVLTVDDVDVPAGRLCDRLRAEQSAYFAERPAPVGR